MRIHRTLVLWGVAAPVCGAHRLCTPGVDCTFDRLLDEPLVDCYRDKRHWPTPYPSIQTLVESASSKSPASTRTASRPTPSTQSLVKPTRPKILIKSASSSPPPSTRAASRPTPWTQSLVKPTPPKPHTSIKTLAKLTSSSSPTSTRATSSPTPSIRTLVRSAPSRPPSIQNLVKATSSSPPPSTRAPSSPPPSTRASSSPTQSARTLSRPPPSIQILTKSASTRPSPSTQATSSPTPLSQTPVKSAPSRPPPSVQTLLKPTSSTRPASSQALSSPPTSTRPLAEPPTSVPPTTKRLTCVKGAQVVIDDYLYEMNLTDGSTLPLGKIRPYEMIEGKAKPYQVDMNEFHVNSLGYNPKEDVLYGSLHSYLFRIQADGTAWKTARLPFSPYIGTFDENGTYWFSNGSKTWGRAQLDPASPNYMTFETGKPTVRGSASDFPFPADWASTPYAPNVMFGIGISPKKCPTLIAWSTKRKMWAKVYEACELSKAHTFGAVMATRNGIIYGLENKSGRIVRFDLRNSTVREVEGDPRSRLTPARVDGTRCMMEDDSAW